MSALPLKNCSGVAVVESSSRWSGLLIILFPLYKYESYSNKWPILQIASLLWTLCSGCKPLLTSNGTHSRLFIIRLAGEHLSRGWMVYCCVAAFAAAAVREKHVFSLVESVTEEFQRKQSVRTPERERRKKGTNWKYVLKSHLTRRSFLKMRIYLTLGPFPMVVHCARCAC